MPPNMGAPTKNATEIIVTKIIPTIMNLVFTIQRHLNTDKSYAVLMLIVEFRT